MTKYTHLDKEYTPTINPIDFIKGFNNIEEFEEWCYTRNLKDLKLVLEKFKKYELYEYCKIIQESISSLTNAWHAFKKDIFIN